MMAAYRSNKRGRSPLRFQLSRYADARVNDRVIGHVDTWADGCILPDYDVHSDGRAHTYVGPLTDNREIGNCHVILNHHILANLYISTDHYVLSDDRPVEDLDAVANDRAGADLNILLD